MAILEFFNNLLKIRDAMGNFDERRCGVFYSLDCLVSDSYRGGQGETKGVIEIVMHL